MYDTTAVANSDEPTDRRTMPSLNIAIPASCPRKTNHGSRATASTISGVTDTRSRSPRNHHTHFPGYRDIAMPASVPSTVAMIAAMNAVMIDTRTAFWIWGFSTIVRKASNPNPPHDTSRRPVLNE